MAAPKWEPGELYVPGDIVQPRTAPPVALDALDNPGFEDGILTGWTINEFGGVGAASVSVTRAFTGTYSGFWQGAAGSGPSGTVVSHWVNDERAAVTPGQTFTVRGKRSFDDGNLTQNVAGVGAYWYDASDTPLVGTPFSFGDLVGGNSEAWKDASATLQVPAGAAYARACFYARANQHGGIWLDDLSWTLASTGVSTLLYKAVQPLPGLSDSTEPAWPTTLGVQVVDNQVIWEAINLTRITWQASPILVTGPTEPAWPTDIGGEVANGTLVLEAVSRVVDDPNCPQTMVVAIISSKVFAVDRDITRYSATANPLDWSSDKDAGFMATGLQQANSGSMAVLAPYRGNLCPFNENCFQNWQVDPNPELISILDQIDGIGSTFHKAAVAVGNELFYLASKGVRTVGIAGASTNLQAGDVGMPIDPWVQAAIKWANDNDVNPLGTYLPATGQYWLAFPGYSASTDTDVFVYTMTETGKVGAWTKYVFPFLVEAFAQLRDQLYMKRTDGHISRLTTEPEDVNTDETAVGVTQPFPGMIRWGYLDLGSPGTTKDLEAFDYVGTGQGPSISIGYNQRSATAFTTPTLISSDTMPGAPIMFPLSAPTMSPKLEFAGGESWRVESLNLYLNNKGGQP